MHACKHAANACRGVQATSFDLLLAGVCRRPHFICCLPGCADDPILSAACRGVQTTSFHLLLAGVCRRPHFICCLPGCADDPILSAACRGVRTTSFHLLLAGGPLFGCGWLDVWLYTEACLTLAGPDSAVADRSSYMDCSASRMHNKACSWRPCLLASGC